MKTPGRLLLIHLSFITFSATSAHAATRPDFSGTWHNHSATPYERPAELGTKAFYSIEEARLKEREIEQAGRAFFAPVDPDRPPPEQGAQINQEADANFSVWRNHLSRVNGKYPTSLVIDPANGRIPFREDGADFFQQMQARGFGLFDGPEIRPASERCLNVVGPMAPMLGWFYNANVRIIQTRNHLMLKGEMLAPRIIALNNQHQRLGHPRWEGESVAHWENETLVIETRNFRPEVSWDFFKSSDALSVVERFTLQTQDEIFYRYTVTDPKIYNAPFTVEMSLTRRAPGVRLYEFACHEGNYSMRGILLGARVQEQEALSGN